MQSEFYLKIILALIFVLGGNRFMNAIRYLRRAVCIVNIVMAEGVAGTASQTLLIFFYGHNQPILKLIEFVP